MHISFSGSLTEQQLRRGITKQLQSLRIVGIVFLILAFIALLIAFLSPQDPRDSFGLGKVSFFGSIGALCLLLPWVTARRQFRTSKLLSSAVTGSATDQSLSMSTSSSSGEITWESFHKALVSKDVVLLYQSAYVFHILPREFFQSEADWLEFQAFVRAKVKPHKSWFIYALAIWIALVSITLIVLRFLPRG